MKEIYLEVREPGMLTWSRVGGQGFATEYEALAQARNLNLDRALKVVGYYYRAVKIEKVVIGDGGE